MNSIRQVPTRVKSRRVEANLGAEREHFDKQQVRKENRNKHKGGDSSCWRGGFSDKPALYSGLLWHRACVCGDHSVPHRPRLQLTKLTLGINCLNCRIKERLHQDSALVSHQSRMCLTHQMCFLFLENEPLQDECQQQQQQQHHQRCTSCLKDQHLLKRSPLRDLTSRA